MIDRLRQGDYYVVSAGSGGKHCELSVAGEDMGAIYIWFLPAKLYLPPAYHRGHFDVRTRRHGIEELVGKADGALPIPNDIRISRLVTDAGSNHTYTPRSSSHGTYVFVLEGGLRCADTLLGRRDSAGTWGVEAIDWRPRPMRPMSCSALQGDARASTRRRAPCTGRVPRRADGGENVRACNG
jgi:quercetin 2,3-dioxygenase